MLTARRHVRTPTVLQMESVECGAASLAMILGYYKRFVPLAELRHECGVSRDGSKASKLVQAARRYGLIAKGFSKQPEDLNALKLPLVVFWRFNHFLIVEGFSPKRVYLNDPAYGHRHVSYEEFNDAFTGVVLTMEPGPEFRRGGRRATLWSGLSQRLRGTYGALAYCVAAGILLVLPGLAVPTFASVFLDRILGESRVDWLRPLLLAMACAILLQAALKSMELWFLRRLKLALVLRLSSQFFWHLLRLPISFYAQRFPGEVSNRSNLNNRVAEVVAGQLALTSVDVCTMAFYCAVMFYYDALLTGVGLAFAAINFLALRWLTRRRVEANMRLAQESGKGAGVAIAALQSIETLKASGLEMSVFARWAGYYAKSANARQELAASSLCLGVLPTLLTSLAGTAILLVGGLKVTVGGMSIGSLVAFQALMTSFLTPVGSLVTLGSTVQELDGDLKRLDDVLENPTVADVRAAPPSDAVPNETQLRGELEFKDVTFGYSPLEPALIQDFSLKVIPGQRVALVGGSGSGKSTVSKLLVGFYAPWSGGIVFDGRLRDQVPASVLHDSLAFVDQDILLFEGTVRDNLTLWDRSVPEEQLVRACQDAAIHDVVLSLPGGFDAPLLEGGANLSGGQRQRLEIARALVNDPSILVLDEATSALDAEVERHIVENLCRRGCTCVMVAHRLSTFRDCDEIVVLERGRVVERGTHETMLAAAGSYAKLIQGTTAEA